MSLPVINGLEQGGMGMTTINKLTRKSDRVRQFVAVGEYKKALSIVKGFRLGIEPEDSGKMTLAYECMIRPSFYEQIGTNPETAITEGIQILKSLYGNKEEVK